MGVRGGLPTGDTRNLAPPFRTFWGVCIIEVAKVHVITLNSPGPTWHPRQPALCAVAQRPTGVDMRMADGTGSRERKRATGAAAGYCPTDRARSV